MAAPYRDILDGLRLAFPKPVSDRIHDSYVSHSVMRALDQIDAMKTEVPVLGERRPLDYAGAMQARVADTPSTVEAVTASLVEYLEGMPIWGHPRSQINVVPPSTIASLVGAVLAGLYNPNLAWDEYSHRVALAEVEAVAMTADLIGYDPARAGGLFTFGGTGTNLYGTRVGLEKAVPDAMEHGVREDVVILASDCSHYCRFNVAGWLGLGASSVVDVPTNAHNEIDLHALGEAARAALGAGKKIAAFVCTMGTTDAFGLDDVEGVVQLRDQLVQEFGLAYRPHVHADAVIGWAWSVFNDYPFEENPLGFRARTVRALAGAGRRIRDIALADSVGIDFHKTGFAPYVSSLILFKERDDLMLLARDAERMPYLYQFGEYHPGMFTLETSRPGSGALAALANLKLFGRQGWQALLGHIVEMAQLLREQLEGHAATSVLNSDNVGTVTLFRAYPDDVDTFEVEERELNDPAYRDELLRVNAYNRAIADYLHDEIMQGRGVAISLTDCYRKTAYGEPVLALKSYILSPFVDEDGVNALVEKVLEARQKVAAK